MAGRDEQIASSTLPFKHTSLFGSHLCLCAEENGQWLQGGLPLHTTPVCMSWFWQASICQQAGHWGTACPLDIQSVCSVRHCSSEGSGRVAESKKSSSWSVGRDCNSWRVQFVYWRNYRSQLAVPLSTIGEAGKCDASNRTKNTCCSPVRV